jgi:hypothetical protein
MRPLRADGHRLKEAQSPTAGPGRGKAPSFVSRGQGGGLTPPRAPRPSPPSWGGTGSSPFRAPEARLGPLAQLAPMGSVDCWPLATTIVQTFGGKPKPVAALGRDRPTVSSSLGTHVAVRGGLAAQTTLRRTALWGTRWGQSDGLAWSLAVQELRFRRGPTWPGAPRGRPFLDNYSAPSWGLPVPPPPQRRRR